MPRAFRDSVEILDTTLRDGAQGKGISFSAQDKIAVVRALDELGVSWIEAGNPGAHPKDREFFREARALRLQTARICAFGATRRKNASAAADPQVQSLLRAETEAVVIFGKSWDLHTTEVLRVTPEENIAMIAETTAYLVEHGRRVFFDAEHFFDGWMRSADYALLTLKTALMAGAERIVLCDTNGGAFPDTVAEGTRAALDVIADRDGVLAGIHAHNDAGFAAANAALAVKAGCRHVQGTLAGFGERCGNTPLAVAIPGIELKLGLPCLPAGRLERLFKITWQVAEIANIAVPENMPYVGAAAFTHKAGMHADGILKRRDSFEHIDPALVGNGRHFLVSEAGGRSAIAERVRKIFPAITRDHPLAYRLAEKLKALEASGWQFEGAHASFELMARRELRALHEETGGASSGGERAAFFRIEAYRVTTEHPTSEVLACSHGWVKVWVDGQEEIAAAEGDGPVNALDGALRRALRRFYPELERVRLSDYKVRVINGGAATAARVRVLIESTDGAAFWNTVGVSEDIIDASRAALVDAIEYKLIAVRENRHGHAALKGESHEK